jgi:hypothetical protein
MKLGKIRDYHYAHKPDVLCASTQPETALHLNTKYYIFNQLLLDNKLYLAQQCSNGCGKTRNITWIKNWDRKRVIVEHNIGMLRPDIQIVNNEETVYAIEVKVTHPVGDEKAEYFKVHNIGWLEVEASESIFEGENAWKIDQPLPFSICTPSLVKWTCDECNEILRKEQELKLQEQKERERRELREQQQSEYKEHNHLETICSTMVDYYFLKGTKFREIYYASRIIRNDKIVGILITNEHRQFRIRKEGLEDEALSEAIKETQNEIERRCKYGAIADQRLWLPWETDTKYFAADTGRYSLRYDWDQQERIWVKLDDCDSEEV